MCLCECVKMRRARPWRVREKEGRVEDEEG